MTGNEKSAGNRSIYAETARRGDVAADFRPFGPVSQARSLHPLPARKHRVTPEVEGICQMKILPADVRKVCIVVMLHTDEGICGVAS